MVLVTVVGELQCKKGFEFVFGGPLAECRECKVKNVCFHLDENRSYRVTNIRSVHHDCKVHEGGVRVVEVERIPTRSAISSRTAVEGSVVSFEMNDCDLISCPNYRLCHPPGAFGGMRFKIVGVETGEIECPKGRSLRIALLE
jgi:uncharacterized protein (UPF0179 family)